MLAPCKHVNFNSDNKAWWFGLCCGSSFDRGCLGKRRDHLWSRVFSRKHAAFKGTLPQRSHTQRLELLMRSQRFMWLFHSAFYEKRLWKIWCKSTNAAVESCTDCIKTQADEAWMKRLMDKPWSAGKSKKTWPSATKQPSKLWTHFDMNCDIIKVFYKYMRVLWK